MKSISIISFIFILVSIFSCKKDSEPEIILICEDFDGYVYDTVRIGTQVWMAENLRTTHFNNGDTLSYKYSIGAASRTYDFEPYGMLYSWDAIIDSRGICPRGWHIPSQEEWYILRDYLGGWKVAGGKMKETGTVHWNEPNVGADNSTGFTALPCGNQGGGEGNWTCFGSTTEWDEINIFFASLSYSSAEFHSLNNNRDFSYMSIRCIRDY